jgi:hypothetical protein
MPEAPVTILGGLPVIAEVSFYLGDGWTTDDAAEVDALYWQKRDGSKGKEVSQAIYDRLDKHNDWWEADVTEQVSDYLSYQSYEEKRDELDRKGGPVTLRKPQ